MAGHSKWDNIKHRKSAQNTKRSKLFSKIIREVVIATRLGGSNVSLNPRLRVAIDKALYNNMTRDTINRAISRNIVHYKNSNIENIIYEGYGPNNTAFMVDCLTDNRNRTISDIRNAFAKCSGSLLVKGSVSYLFTKCNVLSYTSIIDENSFTETALNTFIEDIQYCDGCINVYTKLENFIRVKKFLNLAGFTPLTTEVIMIPVTKKKIDNATQYKLLRFIDILEDFCDVKAVYHNCDFAD
ncbi:MAG: YebC/PmpR family DNA-binding transcriptional regulator [Arsenophonus sp.]|nr:MAG: YebC/PmpR family DNA-binding transcriptional regulator [Arsenophonus sp.]